jgi:hypothetical protein
MASRLTVHNPIKLAKSYLANRREMKAIERSNRLCRL